MSDLNMSLRITIGLKYDPIPTYNEQNLFFVHLKKFIFVRDFSQQKFLRLFLRYSSKCKIYFISGNIVEIPTRNIQMSRHHYGLVVKIFAFGYKCHGFESQHVHFHTGDPQIATWNKPQLTSKTTKTFLKHLTHEPHTQCNAIRLFKLSNFSLQKQIF